MGRRTAIFALAAVLAAVAIAGCGGGSGSDDESSVQEQIEKARHEGAVAAHRRERMAELQRRVTRIERQSRQGAGPTVTAAPRADNSTSGEGSSILRLFHTPSGNVSCAILSDGATCSVASANETFVLESGAGAWTEPGASLSRGSGEAVAYGSTVSAGSVTCTTPAADEPRGVVCTDHASGHGFEASRIESRRSTF